MPHCLLPVVLLSVVWGSDIDMSFLHFRWFSLKRTSLGVVHGLHVQWKKNYFYEKTFSFYEIVLFDYSLRAKCLLSVFEKFFYLKA